MKVIGMISGTSFDAIEAVALEMTMDNRTVQAEILGHVSSPYSEVLRRRVAAILPPHATSIEEVCELDTLIGQSFADVAATVAEQFCQGVAAVVCSHGQTVFHWVDGGHALGTLQIGQGAWIAERTGATVVTDVRSRDIAAGGHGAPLASLLDVLLLGKNPAQIRGALNLGGIANITVVGPLDEPIAFDIGPANALIDAAVTWLTKGEESFDHDGERGTRGSINDAFLSELLADPFYLRPAPKSTGKEYFNLDYLLAHLDGHTLSPNDLLATLTEVTACTVAAAVHHYGVRELFVSGGGTRNPFLMQLIKEKLTHVDVSLVDVFGVPEAAKEAALFALIGYLTIHGVVGSIASCTGARNASIMGAIIPGRQKMMYLPGDALPTQVTFRSSHTKDA